MICFRCFPCLLRTGKGMMGASSLTLTSRSPRRATTMSWTRCACRTPPLVVERSRVCANHRKQMSEGSCGVFPLLTPCGHEMVAFAACYRQIMVCSFIPLFNQVIGHSCRVVFAAMGLIVVSQDQDLSELVLDTSMLDLVRGSPGSDHEDRLESFGS